ncbi:MAG: 30S ribosomal protein S16 [Salinivirgaceae bacterium]|nr:30S ribosomal protein S16 [Salinivirgaceae bacterium]MDY0280120.1 30S ribosomal protein S16 [Salinivirgaceae bacterium]
MPAKIRLARHGRINRPFYHIVVADSRAPRDGRYVERIGSYNPNTHPATITLNFEKALSWLENGAQPTETVNAILRREGVLHMRHLLKGAAKGAFTPEVAEQKFEEWKAKNEVKKSNEINSITQSKIAVESTRFDAEKKKNEERLAKINEAKAAQAKVEAEARAAKAAEAAEVAAEAAVAEESTEENKPSEEK